MIANLNNNKISSLNSSFVDINIINVINKMPLTFWWVFRILDPQFEKAGPDRAHDPTPDSLDTPHIASFPTTRPSAPT